MTNAEIQSKLDAVVVDLQTKGKGQTVNFMFRNPDGSPNVLPLSSDAGGVVNAGELAAVQAFVDGIKAINGDFEAAYTPVKTAKTQLANADSTRAALINAAQNANQALKNSRDNDANYQAKKSAYETAAADADYIAARAVFKSANVVENANELTNARGSYVV
jgi:hypothetical protein